MSLRPELQGYLAWVESFLVRAGVALGMPPVALGASPLAWLNDSTTHAGKKASMEVSPLVLGSVITSSQGADYL